MGLRVSKAGPITRALLVWKFASPWMHDCTICNGVYAASDVFESYRVGTNRQFYMQEARTIHVCQKCLPPRCLYLDLDRLAL